MLLLALGCAAYPLGIACLCYLTWCSSPGSLSLSPLQTRIPAQLQDILVWGAALVLVLCLVIEHGLRRMLPEGLPKDVTDLESKRRKRGLLGLLEEDDRAAAARSTVAGPKSTTQIKNE